MSQITYANIYSAAGDPQANAAFELALTTLRERSEPVSCFHRINGKRSDAGSPFDRHDPVSLARVVSRAHEADAQTVAAAVDASREAAGGWRRTSPSDRIALFRGLGPLITERTIELAALASYETGKTRADAIAEVSECVAILELCLEQYEKGDAFSVPLRAPTEDSLAHVVLQPYGVFGVVAPFNFPFAIPFAMTFGALLMGNTVVFKPSGLTPACGDAVADLFEAVGLPPGILNTVHGGGVTGEAVVKSAVDGIVFTGSAEVGLGIVEQLSRPPFIRPVIAEMGGKNPAIVTNHTPDVNAAAIAVARSAFGMSGQKCNACSRAIVTDGIYDEFLERLIAFTESINVADPLDANAFTGPVATVAARDRFNRLVEAARADGVVRVGGGVSGDDDLFVECTVVDGLPVGHALTRDEAFLPFLTVTRVADFDEAITEANDVEYGLSAGLWSIDKTERARFLDEIQAGIVFVSNPGGATTGVWPGSQTMSGWKASGTSGKGGFGPWYLQQFGREQSRTIFAA